MAERPRIFLDNTGIQESYAQAQFNANDSILGWVGAYGGQWGKPDISRLIPATRENQLSFLRFLHHNTEQTMEAFSLLGVSEDDVHDLIYLSQQRWKVKNNESCQFSNIQEVLDLLGKTSQSISKQVEDVAGDYKTEEKVTLSAALVRPADIHDLNHILATLLYDETLLKPFKSELKKMSSTMTYISRLLRGLSNKHPTLLSVANRMSEGIASEWYEYLSHLYRSTENTRAKSALLEAKSLFGSMLSITETESIDIMEFFASQEQYFQTAAHRHDETKRLQLHLEDNRLFDNVKNNRIQADRGKLITLMRNLVEDAVMHGDYPEDTIDIAIELAEDEKGLLLVKVSNSLYITSEAIQTLCEKMGNERVVLNEEGGVETLSLHDTEGPYKLHGLGKMSVALTVRQALTQAGVPLQQQFEYMKNHWSFTPQEDTNTEGKQWFQIHCNVPLVKSA